MGLRFGPSQSFKVHALSPPSGCLSITSDFMISPESQLYLGPVSQLQGTFWTALLMPKCFLFSNLNVRLKWIRNKISFLDLWTGEFWYFTIQGFLFTDKSCPELMVCSTFLDGTVEWWWWSKSGPGLQNLEAALTWDSCPYQNPLCRLTSLRPPFWQKFTPLPLLLFLIKVSKILTENHAISDIIADTGFSHWVMQWSLEAWSLRGCECGVEDSDPCPDSVGPTIHKACHDSKERATSSASPLRPHFGVT